MLSHVVIACIFVLGIVAALVLTGHHAAHISFAFWDFFGAYPWLMIYIGIVNVITFAAFAIDKRKAVKGRWRIRVATLLVLAFIGGAPGGLLAMYLFRHKTQTKHFTVGLPLMLVTQIIVLFYCMNAR